MHYYIVDPQKISQKEFDRVQHVLYSSLSEFKISGEVVRMTGLRTIQQLVENAFDHGAKTLVAVGSDETLHEVINAVGKREIVIGFIPLIDSEMGNIFGIKDTVQAIKTIAFRRIMQIDLGKVNDYYFLSGLSFGIDTSGGIKHLFNLPKFEIEFMVDGKYKAKQTVVGGVVINSRGSEKNKIGDPVDEWLDVLLLPEQTRWNTLRFRKQIINKFFEELPLSSVLHVKNIEITEPTGMPIKINDKIVTRTPAKIEIVPKMLTMIVGKERNF